jgi:hypothetical protein
LCSLEYYLFNFLSFHKLEIIKQINKREDHIINDAKAILYKENEMLEKYVQQANIESLDKEILIKVGKQICQEEESK